MIINEVLHRIRAKLYPNYLQNVHGAYIARTDDEASLSIEQVCAALKNRGGGTGSYADYVEHVKLFLDEAAHQLCDGFSINLGYFSLHPRIGGTWESAAEPHDPVKHPVRFSFRALKPLLDLARRIEVLIEGIHDGAGYIAELIDVTTEAVNETLTPGGMFTLAGHKIKVSGTHPDCGVYFVPADGSGQKVKVPGHLADNTPRRIIGIVPPLGAGKWQVQVITQFASGGGTTKEPRTITFASALTVV